MKKFYRGFEEIGKKRRDYFAKDGKNTETWPLLDSITGAGRAGTRQGYGTFPFSSTSGNSSGKPVDPKNVESKTGGVFKKG